MPNRTVKLIGRAYSQSGDMPGDGSVSITVNFNGTQVYSVQYQQITALFQQIVVHQQWNYAHLK